jgi:hypothetical protein
MGYPPTDGTESLMRSTGRWGGVAPAGKAAVSVVAPNDRGVFNLVDVAAGQGQSHLNRPPGYGGGNGTGDNDEGQAAGGAAGEQGWSKSGCEAMQQASFPNSGKWKYSEDQTDYVVKVLGIVSLQRNH